MTIIKFILLFHAVQLNVIKKQSADINFWEMWVQKHPWHLYSKINPFFLNQCIILVK